MSKSVVLTLLVGRTLVALWHSLAHLALLLDGRGRPLHHQVIVICLYFVEGLRLLALVEHLVQREVVLNLLAHVCHSHKALQVLAEYLEADVFAVSVESVAGQEDAVRELEGVVLHAVVHHDDVLQASSQGECLQILDV